LFFIQPMVRTLFKILSAKDIENRKKIEEQQAAA